MFASPGDEHGSGVDGNPRRAYRRDMMHNLDNTGSSRVRVGRLAAGLSLVAVVALSGFANSPDVRAQDQAVPAGEQAVADRYIVTVSGMT